jgi:glycosyltransferase involved in cell wall biosynthesis
MKLLSYIYTYYESPLMYQRQLQEWSKYPDSIKKEMEIRVVDDCSEQNMITKPSVDIDLRVFRITKKIKWNLYAGRNIGADKATGKWFLFSDIDLVVPVSSMEMIWKRLMGGELNENTIYRFTRIDVTTNAEIKPHGFTFLMTRDLFFKIGGYDEEYAGLYYNMCALYFGQIERYYARNYDLFVQLPIPLIYYTNGVIPDASKADTFVKNKLHDDIRRVRIQRRKKEQGREGTVKTLLFPYQEIGV